MPNIATDPGFVSSRPGYATDVALNALDPTQHAQLVSALTNIGLLPPGSTAASIGGLSLAYAVGQFQQYWGYGAPSGTFTTDMWYGLLYTNDVVANHRTADTGVWNSLVGARNAGAASVADPTTWQTVPPPGAVLPPNYPVYGGPAGTNPIAAPLPPAAPPAPAAPVPPAPAPAAPAAPVPPAVVTPVTPAPTPGAPPPPATAPPGAPGAGGAPDFTDAYALIDVFLRAWDLGPGSEFDLSAWARNALTSPVFNPAVFTAQLELTDAYQTRFGQTIMGLRGPGAVGTRLTPADILAWERTAADISHRAALPASFYDNWRDFAPLIADGQSVAEFQDRVFNGILAVTDAAPEVRQAFAEFYGPSGDSMLSAYFLDPDAATPLLIRQAQAAGIAGTGYQFDLNVGQSRAEQLAYRGVSGGQAASTFGRLVAEQGLFTETVSERTNLDIDVEGINAAFGLDQGQASTALARRQSEREAALSGGGGAYATQRGIIGLGTAE